MARGGPPRVFRAWPSPSGPQGRHRSPALKGGSRRSFLTASQKRFSGALDAGGADPGNARCSGTVGRVTRTDRASAVPKTRVTAGNHRPAGFGASRPASATVPVSAPAREGAAQPTPQARTVPAHSPLRPWSWRSCPYQFTRSFFGTWRLLLPVPAWAEAPASVRRRRALEKPVEEIVTTSAAPVVP
jgi:hypothetical protein